MTLNKMVVITPKIGVMDLCPKVHGGLARAKSLRALGAAS